MTHDLTREEKMSAASIDAWRKWGRRKFKGEHLLGFDALCDLAIAGLEGRGWQSMGTAPKDGDDILLRMEIVEKAYWDAEIKAFVLHRPLLQETVSASSRRTTWQRPPETLQEQPEPAAAPSPDPVEELAKKLDAAESMRDTFLLTNWLHRQAAATLRQLSAERDALNKVIAGNYKRLDETYRELSAVKATNERLKKGLHPFARVAALLDFYVPEVFPLPAEFPHASTRMDDYGPGRVTLDADDFLNARSLLGEK